MICVRKAEPEMTKVSARRRLVSILWNGVCGTGSQTRSGGRQAAGSPSRNHSIGVLALPNPGILALAPHQPSAHWILANVIHTIDQAVVGSQHMIRKLLLPNWTRSIESYIDLPRSSAFDGLHNLRQAVAPAILPAQWRVNQMNMIRHNDGGMEIEFLCMLVQAALENNIPSERRKVPTAVGVERDEQGVIVLLEMRKTTAVIIISAA